jgi:2-polyprenyl-3-methyl-5-hydroxy-6-metoxy-1,4-benzoquinol methylase
MTENRLNIIQVSLPENSPYSLESTRSFRTKEMQAKFERLWLLHPEQFDPLERERLERTWQLLTDHTSLKDKQIVDLGCGRGIFSRRMRDAGAKVKAVDIAENALKAFQKEDKEYIIYLQQDAMPNTSLPDQSYDVVICTELIAHLYPDDYRLFFAELARIVRTDGYLVCSSAIDIHSDGGRERLAALTQTEFDLVGEVVSYHALYLHLKWFFQAPARFIEARTIVRGDKKK